MAGMAKLAKLGKTLWKGISYIPKKAHTLQRPFAAPADGKLTIGQKLTNAALKTTEYTAYAGILGATGASAYELYQSTQTDNHKEYEEHSLKTSKYLDATVGGIAGLLLGGPIGALALGAAAYFTPKDLLLGKAPVCIHGGKSITYNELRQEKAAEAKKAQETQKPEQKEEKPEVEEDKKAVEEFCKGLEELEVGQTITVPEIKAESGAITMQVGDQTVELNAGDKITRTEEGFKIIRADAAEKQKEEPTVEETEGTTQEEVQEDAVPPTREEETEPEEQVEQTQEPEEEQTETQTQQEEQVQQQQNQEQQEQESVEQTPPTNNLFGGEINEITKKDVKIENGDCLWNIAKRELQAVNQGKTITNAQILKQVKEFGRLNPNIKNLDLIYPKETLKLSA